MGSHHRLGITPDPARVRGCVRRYSEWICQSFSSSDVSSFTIRDEITDAVVANCINPGPIDTGWADQTTHEAIAVRYSIPRMDSTVSADCHAFTECTDVGSLTRRNASIRQTMIARSRSERADLAAPAGPLECRCEQA